MTSVATRSSGPALRCSLFCSVCLISCLSSWGMSLRCAMSRIRVRGVDALWGGWCGWCNHGVRGWRV